MGKSTAFDFDLKFPTATEAKTIVLAGETGYGISATGNSIIGANVFHSSDNCQMHRTVLPDGQILNVIDTPGLSDFFIDPKKRGKEIAKCIKMAKNGINAILVVVSIRTRYLLEEASAIESLRQFFGPKIGDYMILVFTNDEALCESFFVDFFAHNCPEPLVKILRMCGNRCVLFDNWTEDEVKKSQQLKKLLHLVDTVVDNNDGVPYTKELFMDSPDISNNGLDKAYEEQRNGFLEKTKLREMALMLEKQLAEERNARMQAEAMAVEAQMKLKEFKAEQEKLQAESWEISKLNMAYEDQLLYMESRHQKKILMLEKQLQDEQDARMQAEAAQKKSNYEISKLREELERAQIEAWELRKTHEETQELLKKRIREKNDEGNQKKTNNCAISEVTSGIEQKIESKLRETSLRLETQLAEKFARMQAEDRESNDEIRKLREDMERAQIEARELTSAMELQFRKLLADEKVARLLAEKKSNDEISKLREDLERVQRDGEMLRLTDFGSKAEGTPDKVDNMPLKTETGDEMETSALRAQQSYSMPSTKSTRRRTLVLKRKPSRNINII